MPDHAPTTSPDRAAYAFAVLAVEQAYERYGENMDPDVSLAVLRIIDALCEAADHANGEPGTRFS